ncbi:MAG TPA: DUF3182 family protein [Ramlibacter sp.]|nr:DUF3182 family protein [Ramlibacter sp.]
MAQTIASSSNAAGVVVAHVPDPADHASEHERATLLGFARQLACLMGYEEGGLYDPSRPYARRPYFVPSSTLTCEEAAALGIRGPDDLFGGVVPHRFVGTKAISHPLVSAGAAAPSGWRAELATRLCDTVLRGHAAFSQADAREGGLRLLACGPLRIKAVRATGGHGQSVVRDAAQLEAALDAMDKDEVEAHGVVLEEDLDDVRTFSVGQVQVGGLTASYFGVQRLTRNNRGEVVFGGSDLDVSRGGYEAVLSLELTPEVRRAVEQARRYDAAVKEMFPAFHASRSNYDVALGRDAQGQWRSGVLEQSWRVGGATGPELAALAALNDDPARLRVRASCFELFGDSPEPPPHATVYFRGDDARAGRLTKYTVIEQHGDAR